MLNSYKPLIKTGLVSLLASSLVFNFSSCSTFLKNLVEKTEEGKAFASFVGKTYDPTIKKETSLKLPPNFYERILDNNIENNLDTKSTLVRIVTPGWGCPIERYGDFLKQDSPLGKMYQNFEGLIGIVDYDPKNTLETSAIEIASQINKLSREAFPSKLEFELLSFSHSGNIAREIVRQDYCPDLKSVRFIASPLNGTKFIFPDYYILDNYPSILGLDREISDPSFSQLLNGNKFYEKNKTLLNKKNIDYYIIGVENLSKNPLVQGGVLIPGKDDKVVPLKSQLFKQIAEYDGCEIKGIKIYQGNEIDHINILTNPFVIEDLMTWIKEGDKEKISIIPEIIKIPNLNSNKKKSSLFPSLNNLNP